MRQPFDPDMLTPFERALMRIDDPAVPKPSADDLMALLDEPSSENRDWNPSVWHVFPLPCVRSVMCPGAARAASGTIEAMSCAIPLAVIRPSARSGDGASV